MVGMLVEITIYDDDGSGELGKSDFAMSGSLEMIKHASSSSQYAHALQEAVMKAEIALDEQLGKERFGRMSVEEAKSTFG